MTADASGGRPGGRKGSMAKDKKAKKGKKGKKK
jgi:hypothetical protein